MGASSEEGFRLDQTFFIPSTSSKKKIHEEIFYLVWLGEGRWDWNTIYNWPIWLRKFYKTQLEQILTPQTKKAKPTATKSTGVKPPF